MPAVSKRKAASRQSWDTAMSSIKTGAKKVIQIITPRKKKRRKIEMEKENDADIAEDSDILDTQSLYGPSQPDDDVFLSPEPATFIPDFGDLPMEAHSQFGAFSTHARISPSKSSVLGRIWHDFTPRLLSKLSPSRKSAMLANDSTSILNSDTSSNFVLSPDDPIDSASSKSVDSASLKSLPDTPVITDAELAERARLREQAAKTADGHLREAPSVAVANAALVDLGKVLRPPRKKGPGYIDPKIDPFTRSRIEGMRNFLALYANPKSPTYGKWKAASTAAAITMCRGSYCARVLRRLARQYIADRSVLPENPYGNWNETLLVNEDLCNELMEYLQFLGSTKDKDGKESGITSAKVQAWLAQPEIMQKYAITKPISLATAKRYLHALGFRFSSPVKGQYVDGHERADVRFHRDKMYIPKLSELRTRMRVYSKDGVDITADVESMVASGKRVVIWYHDESIFYAHDRTRKSWRHKDASIKPHKKGEGASLMVADYISADFGWLVGPKTGRSARVILKPGKNRDGYFTSDDILAQARVAMDILTEFGDDIEHENAEIDPSPIQDWEECWSPEGQPIYNPDGTLLKEKIPMTGASFADGHPQSLYFENGPHAGMFKGMEQILTERGYNVKGKKAECLNFQCAVDADGHHGDCCMRRMLFNEPDFAAVQSLLEDQCSSQGIAVIFLPKFHCELNPIEQCWGYAKRLYRLCPESSREEDLEKNMLDSLDAIPLICIRR
ncbi:hypothetical protein B0H11DRAFT_2249507 [Mycena galericulata]|nr:hypothetical protein B0H11DRAFT_2249507 [Mycena galericulata]